MAATSAASLSRPENTNSQYNLPQSPSSSFITTMHGVGPLGRLSSDMSSSMMRAASMPGALGADAELSVLGGSHHQRAQRARSFSKLTWPPSKFRDGANRKHTLQQRTRRSRSYLYRRPLMIPKNTPFS